MLPKANKAWFDRKEAVPDDVTLKKVVGALYSDYLDILSLAGGYSREWKYYGKKYGWQLKVTRKGKSLFYLIPLEKSFRMGFAVREKERETLLNLTLPAKVREELRRAKKYSEGYPLRLSVSAKNDMRAVRLVVDALMSLRQAIQATALWATSPECCWPAWQASR